MLGRTSSFAEDLPHSEGQLSSVWTALADPTRRQILDYLRDRPHTTGELANQFPSSRFAIMKHLNILESAGLVLVRRQGRERWNHLNVVPIQFLYDRWVKPFHGIWAERLTDLKMRIEGIKDMNPANIERVELQIPIQAPCARVWKALTEETRFWWPPDFYASPRAKGFYLEPKLGGKMFEDWGDGSGVVWYEIFAIDQLRSIDLKGAMAVPFGPALSLLHLELQPDNNGTILMVSDSIFGFSTDDGKSKHEGWRQIFESSLKKYVEENARTQ